MTASVPRLGQAQERAVRIGFLRQAGPHQKQFDAFREGLRAAGYEGQFTGLEDGIGDYVRGFLVTPDPYI